ncbi:KATNB1-like protein 1 [Nerophis lumbriciformis]|uniref:KATNB1-like protein 1 n=1 Tax=Nerophis lumbriciformis TaxID=546530 RepID=UPI002AE082CD|nr:KATNB1-like protein 1 [Nerophis lumbriciformis]XP_061843133.1 KATNB1-like protein 1 [Nerophis lumbriciformis]
MKQVDIVNKDKLDKERFQVCYGVNNPGKAKKSLPCKRRSSPLPVVGSKLHRRTSDVGRGQHPGMANKENEVTCSDVRGNHYKDNCGPSVSAAEASKMAGASSKYSDFTELSKDHEAMTHVLFGRNLRLKVALTLWRRNTNELVAYLIRIQDTGVLLDLLPVITNDLQTEAPCFSLGCCVDLIPQVKVILSSNYEEHLIAGLHWVQSVIKKWWPELSKTDKRLRDSLDNRNIEVLKQRLKDLWKDGARLCLVPGSTGDLAKGVEVYVLQLR